MGAPLDCCSSVEDATNPGLVELQEAGDVVWSARCGGDGSADIFALEQDTSGSLYLAGRPGDPIHRP